VIVVDEAPSKLPTFIVKVPSSSSVPPSVNIVRPLGVWGYLFIVIVLAVVVSVVATYGREGLPPAF